MLVGMERSKKKFLPDTSLVFPEFPQQHSLRAADKFKPPSSRAKTS